MLHACVVTAAACVQMKEFPASVKHVIFMSATPIIYPGMGIVESLLMCFNKAPATNLLLKTGARPPACPPFVWSSPHPTPA